MMRVVGWILFALVAVLVVLFAVQNRMTVELGLEPLLPPIAMPLFAAVCTTFVAGFVLGALLDRLLGLGVRWRARASRGEADRLRREVDRLNAELAAARRVALERGPDQAGAPATGPASGQTALAGPATTSPATRLR